MKEIMGALCRAWKPEWQGLVMAELRYEVGRGGSSRPYDITISEKRLVRLSASSKETGEAMSLVLLPLRGRLTETEEETAGRPWRRFTAKEVQDFSRSLGDHNELHQSAHPLVSGFHILFALKEMISAPALRLRFHQPLYADQMLWLAEEEGVVRGYAEGALRFTCEEIK